MGKPKRNRELFRFTIAAALLSVMAGWPRAFAAEQRVALVIGNSAYSAAPLKSPVNDARVVAKTLNQLNFDVLLKTNLNQRAMIEAIREFSSKLKEGDVALFYYSGHGMQVRGRNFLIPIDADIQAEDEVPYLSFDVSQVLDKLEFAHTRANIVILDACRNNPFIRTFRSARVGLAQMDAPGGTLIAFSTAPGSEARDGDTEYGTYTGHLIEQLPIPGLPVEVMFRRVREGVRAETKDRQTPWESSSLTGDFFFKAAIAEKPAPVPTPAPAPVAVQQIDPMMVELAFWDSIKASANRSDFEAYLEQYPNGRFAALARNRVKALEPNTGIAGTGVTAPNTLATTPGEPAQVALASPSAPAAGSPSFKNDWAPRIALLEKSRGQLTLSRAVAILLGIESAEDLNLLLTHEAEIKRKSWHNSYAMGIDNKGNLIWGGVDTDLYP